VALEHLHFVEHGAGTLTIDLARRSKHLLLLLVPVFLISLGMGHSHLQITTTFVVANSRSVYVMIMHCSSVHIIEAFATIDVTAVEQRYLLHIGLLLLSEISPRFSASTTSRWQLQ